jgi:hypothetical protein
MTASQEFMANKACHPERVIKLLHHIVFIADNMPIFGCAGTVQAACANFDGVRVWNW